MRKTFSAAVLMAGLLASSALAETLFMKVTGVRAGDTLNVRTGPGGSFNDIGDFQPGEVVRVLGYDASRNWAQVRYRGQIAWVSARFLKPTVRSNGTPTGIGTMYVTGIKVGDPDGGLVVRNAAGKGGARLGVLSNGTGVQVIQRSPNGKWAMISFGTGVGWISTAYLTRTNAGNSGSGNGGTITTANGFPLGIFCLGTEPFWSFEIAADRTVTYTQLSAGAQPITSLVNTTPSGNTGSFPYQFLAPPYSGTLNVQQCSDGMSDNSYTMSVRISDPTQVGGSATLNGCCNIQP